MGRTCWSTPALPSRSWSPITNTTQPSSMPLATGSRGLAGHAAFETFSIVTRLPPPARRGPGAVARLLAHNFPATRFPGVDAAGELLARLGTLGFVGGAVYDAEWT